MENLLQILLLLGVAVGVVVAFQKLHIPTSLGYLLVGVILSPATIGPHFDIPEVNALAQFGVVFLLFSIGLNYSLPQLLALRNQVLGLGTLQVVLTTALVALVVWWLGFGGAAVAFVVGAVFAQSSSSIIGSQLTEQGEESTPSGRLALAMSVFQDVTAVPFLIIIPVLGAAVTVEVLGLTLGTATLKAAFAFAMVFFAGRWLLRPLFRVVTRRQSQEALTLAVLFVVLVAAWATHMLGLSLAFGAFLAGMMLGETEFRHQVESTIRPFRDVLLGLFFIGIGMLFDPRAVWLIWHWALLGALLLLLAKILVVVVIVRRSGFDLMASWQTALVVAVGGEFGLALLALALEAGVIELQLSQILLTSVLFSLIAGAVLIRFNQPIAALLSGQRRGASEAPAPDAVAVPDRYVLIGGYGRVGHTIAVLLRNSNVPFVAFDTDQRRVSQGHADGHRVYYGDISDPELLAAIHPEKAALVVLTTDHISTSIRTVEYLRRRCPHIPIIARAMDLQESAQLMSAGATHAYPETIEASLRLAATAMTMLHVPSENIDELMQGIRDWDYVPVLEEPAKS